MFMAVKNREFKALCFCINGSFRSQRGATESEYYGAAENL